ncbi:MAG: hypothetical protein Q9201_004678, partial [Fulgogasparrea decipioides]
MAKLTEDDIRTIADYPLEPSLTACQKSLQSIALRSPDASLANASEDPELRKAIVKLITELKLHAVAEKLKHPSGETLADELGWASPTHRSTAADLQPFFPVATLVMQRASDAEVWHAVLDLPSSPVPPLPVTPRRSTPALYDATPIAFSSSSRRDLEQTRDPVEAFLREELKDCCYVKVGGFVEKFFHNKRWSPESSNITGRVGLEPDDFPHPPAEGAVWDWLANFQHSHLDPNHTPSVYRRTLSPAAMTGSDAARQVDILTQSRTIPAANQVHWRDIRVIGELSRSADAPGKFLQLARYARDVFSAQPTRLFVHGFLLLGSTMELHLFDRAGVVSAAKFDVRLERARFIQILTGYSLMSDEELGLDTTFVRRDGPRMFVNLPADDSQERERELELDPNPIARQPAIACRATCCYRTTDGEHVIKFSWVSDRRVPEADHLKAARNVPGVARLCGHRRITSIDEIRKGLIFSQPRHFGNASRKASSSSRSWPALCSSVDDGTRSKRPWSHFAAEAPRKKSRSNSRAEDAAADHVMEPNKRKYENRVLGCLAIRPAGRPLEEFQDVPELLKALRDAICAHQSLLHEAKILHRDISTRNIIITEPDKTGGLHGILIDLDMATRVGLDGKNEGSGASHLTGTLEFMAIEVLQHAFRSPPRHIQHTYRHDLESFFYVFLSVCIKLGWPGGRRPDTSPLIGWYSAPLKDIPALKSGHMLQSNFESQILAAFSPPFECVQDLALRLRKALFGEGFYVATPFDKTVLYQDMIAAFDETIHRLESADRGAKTEDLSDQAP